MTLILFLLFYSFKCQADIGLNLGLVKPTGYLGFVLKPAIGFRLDAIDEFNSPWRIRAGFTYVDFDTREDTFRIAAYEYNSNVWTTYPGWQVFRTTKYFSINIGADYAFYRSNQFSYYVGLDFTVGGFVLDYDAVVPGMSERSAEETVYFLGFPLRLGIDYSITDKVGVYGEATRYFNWGNRVGWRTMNTYGIGLRYQIF